MVIVVAVVYWVTFFVVLLLGFLERGDAVMCEAKTIPTRKNVLAAALLWPFYIFKPFWNLLYHGVFR